ncbi:aldehyde ferredoxin oxidoreductase [Clostridium bovifaecis]|uniref:Aldehyde ferredoxin oxidoreductase n=1 Tax=Clostridium bovifaecis TaxID=2184719 RepID=A0A6I6EZG9_9CLOT|nr:aldehyde ferredoxin oxidoreductase [Clostridium bovifaecis]
MFGYAGKILDINLSESKIKGIFFGEKELKEYLGGVGLTSKILYDNIKRKIDPLGPDNILVFGVGTMVGTNITTASRTEASAISPATGLIGTSNSGNYFGSELKYAGYDGIILRGKAEKPVYLWISDGKVEIRDAGFLWGKDSWDTIKSLREELNIEELQVACIGQGGENLVRFASIQNGPYDAWGRTGLGAVMGSKNLKAIAVKGFGSIRPAKRKELIESVIKVNKTIKESPFYGAFSKFGTMLATLPYSEQGALPGRNFQTGIIEDWVETRSRKVVQKYSNKGVACIACPIACAHWAVIKEGSYKGLEIKDMEVTPVMGFGAGCDIRNMASIIKITEICQRLGLDMVSAASIAAFAMELYEKGVIDKKDLGFSLNWGEEESVIKLLYNIANREGLGEILGEGTLRASKMIKNTEKYAIHVKGLEIPMADARGRWSTWTFGNITNLRGGDHLRNRNPVENLQYNENIIPYRSEKFGFPDKIYENFDMPQNIKNEVFNREKDYVDIIKMSKWAEDLISLYNAVGLCIRPPVLQSIGPTLIAELFTNLTGISLTADEAIKAGERIWNVQKLINIIQGEKPEDSVFPERFYEERLKGEGEEGKGLDRTEVQKTLEEYFQYRNWNMKTGVPNREKLRELNIK